MVEHGLIVYRLKIACGNHANGISGWCRENRLSISNTHAVISGKALPGPTHAAAVGYRPIQMYRTIFDDLVESGVVIKAMQREISVCSIREWADRIGVAFKYVERILAGTAIPNEIIAAHFGMKIHLCYERQPIAEAVPQQIPPGRDAEAPGVDKAPAVRADRKKVRDPGRTRPVRRPAGVQKAVGDTA